MYSIAPPIEEVTKSLLYLFSQGFKSNFISIVRQDKQLYIRVAVYRDESEQNYYIKIDCNSIDHKKFMNDLFGKNNHFYGVMKVSNNWCLLVIINKLEKTINDCIIITNKSAMKI